MNVRTGCFGSWAAVVAVLGVVAGVGCQSDDSDSTDASSPQPDGSMPSGDDDGASVPSSDPLYGSATVDIVPRMPATRLTDEQAERTTVLVKVADGVQPEIQALELEDEAGGCRLLTPSSPFCDPRCSGGAVCVQDDLCVPYPNARDVGTISVSGLGADFDMRFVATGYQLPTGLMLSWPPCAEGEEVRFDAEGGAYRAFSLSARCVAPMTLTDAVRIERGQPLALRWTQASQPDLARVHVELDISHHGGLRGLIECDVEDSGSLDIPASLVDRLVDLGVAGFPAVTVSRMVTASGSTEQSREVQLKLSATSNNDVEIPGLTSCTIDDHCPSGETCQPDFRCG
jgi:hypothetical protein